MFSGKRQGSITHNRDYTYSDVVVTNDPRDLEGNDEYFVHHPCVIFEVVSKNSRLDDTVDKFIRYKNIESLRNYVLVDSEKKHVEVRTKLERGEWESDTYLPSDVKFPIPFLGIEMSFEQVYEGLG